jgi:uncharacterized protein (DUF433 family)
MGLKIASEPVPLRVDADGTVRVGDTRVTLDVVVEAFLEGASAEEIVEQLPVLDLGDVYAVIGFYLHHQEAVDAYLQERRQHASDVRAWIEARHNPAGIRERLLARRSRQSEG